MKHYKLDDKAIYQDKFDPKEEDTTDYFAQVKKQKKEERILAVTVAVLTIMSLIGSYIGASHFIKLETVLSYLMLGAIIIPLAFVLGGVTFLILYKEEGSEIREQTITFSSISFLVFVLIGNSISVFFLIEWGTTVAYFISAMIICVVFYLVFRAVRSRLRDKNLTHEYNKWLDEE